ncbi:tRNA pseudouridine(55) synthase TruB [Tahibacter amnicola]|uniref:tRNA pseudouridine synthase B n=1 Tax=Tahibacter amnicola TaxID=2976241 RepID=A0ABY6BMY6_9GAMM|nr:tRNA pseudouridine(55) synthase TruB [Tahibacter amnicola]UXI69745.1 tRNA pseudouridine(55) synthase TruB [Tahibacter amnicola]
MSKKPDPTAWRDVHGIVLLDKPKGLSSNQALQKVRRLYAAAKGGHTGSLDPMATGLLPICLGEATKIAGYLLGSGKAYVATVELGTTTVTGDAEGEIDQVRPVPTLTAADVEQALAPLRGRIWQTPPVYSALKQGGVPLYRLARQGETVVVAPRQVEVHRLEVLSQTPLQLTLLVECGSGTYIRSLAVDLGGALGCGAHLSALRRTWVDPFRVPQMFTVDALEATLATQGRAALDRLILPTDQGLAGMPLVTLDADQARRLQMGQPVRVGALAPGLCRVHDAAGHLIALGEVEAGDLKVRRGLNLPV